MPRVSTQQFRRFKKSRDMMVLVMPTRDPWKMDVKVVLKVLEWENGGEFNYWFCQWYTEIYFCSYENNV